MAPRGTTAAGRSRRVLGGGLLSIVLALTCALAPRAEAHLYWTNNNQGSGTTIGRANLDGTALNQRFITGATDPCGVAVDAGHIYWANRKRGTIGRANIDGSSVDQDFITVGNLFPCGVAVNATHIYWANLFGGNDNAGSIGRAQLDGSNVQSPYISGGSVSGPTGVALDSNYLYWINSDLYGPTPIVSSVQRFPIDLGPPHQIVNDAGYIPFWPAVSSSRIYWGVYSFGITSTDLEGNDGAQFLMLNAGGGIAVHGGRLYWADNTQGTFSSANLDGSSPDFAFMRGATRPFGLAVDSLRSPPFEFGKLLRNRKRGTATLTVILPGPGRLVLSGRGVKRAVKQADGGREKLRIRAKGKAKRKLDSTGKARVKANVTHIPTGGSPASRSKRLKLIER